MKKIVLGTANLNMNYGISKFKHKKNFFDKPFTRKIIRRKIKFVDTALNYKLNNEINNFEKFRVINKIKLPPKKKDVFIKNLEEIIKQELRNNNKKSFYAILFHDPKDLYSKSGKFFLKKMISLKKKKYYSKIGVSIYDPKELKKIYNIFKPEIVQFPINIFDQRMLNGDFLNLLKRKKIITQARSIFLQGILLNNNKSQNHKLSNKFNLKLKEFSDWCYKRNISKLDACIDFVNQLKNIDLVTIGFENFKQIHEILLSFSQKKKFNYDKLSIKDKKIIDPRKW